MSVNVERLEHNMAKLTIEVSKDKFDAAVDKAYNRQKGQINIPGFRKGKAPRKIIEKYVGIGVFYEEATRLLVNEEYPIAASECGEDIVSAPVIDVEQVEMNKPFIFTATVAIKPEVELGIYKGLEIEKADISVSDEDIDKELEQERDKNARIVEVTDRPIKDDDEAVIDFVGSVDGVEFEGGAGENHALKIGSGQFIPGFEDQLIGKNLGEEVDVIVTFPEEYHAKDLAGAEALFKVVIKEIKERKLPELNDEFAEEVSEFDTLDEYKADIRAKLEERKKNAAKVDKEQRLVEMAVENATMDIPKPMIENTQREMLEEFESNMSRSGLRIEDYYKYTGANEEIMMAQVEPEALKRIKGRLVLEAIVKEESIVASEEDYNKEIESMAKQYNMETDKLAELIDEERKELMMKDIAIPKAIEFLVNNCVEI